MLNFSIFLGFFIFSTPLEVGCFCCIFIEHFVGAGTHYHKHTQKHPKNRTLSTKTGSHYPIAGSYYPGSHYPLIVYGLYNAYH